MWGWDTVTLASMCILLTILAFSFYHFLLESPLFVLLQRRSIEAFSTVYLQVALRGPGLVGKPWAWD